MADIVLKLRWFSNVPVPPDVDPQEDANDKAAKFSQLKNDDPFADFTTGDGLTALNRWLVYGKVQTDLAGILKKNPDAIVIDRKQAETRY